MRLRSQLGAAIGGVVVMAALALLVPLLAVAGSGDQDRSFGGDGVVELGTNDTILRGAAVQRDGKLVAVGERGREAGDTRLLVVRFNRNGSLDRSFKRSSSGLPLLGSERGGVFVGARGTTGYAVAIQRNGRIVVAGGRTDRSGSTQRGMLVMRLNPNGTRDRSFSGDGLATALARRDGRANAVDLAGGRILIAGSANLGRESDAFPRLALAGFRANGSRARRFGAGGARILDFGRFSVANAIAVRGDGRILLAGSQRGDLQTTRVLAARLTARGRRDRSFNRDGLLVRQYASGGAAYSEAFDLASTRGGKVVLGGVAASGTGLTALAIRLGPRGSPDRGFSGDGAAYMRAAASRDQYDQAGQVAGAYGVVRAGRRVVLAGSFDSFGTKRLAVWALKANGRPARGFGRGGRTITPFGQRSAQLRGLAIAPGGKLYGVGDVGNVFDGPNGLAARYDD